MHALPDDVLLHWVPLVFVSLTALRAATLQVQLSMLAVALLTTFPLLCSAGHLAHAPFAETVRAFAGAAEDFSGAVFPMPPGQQSAVQQCRQLHLLVYVRPLRRPPAHFAPGERCAWHYRHCISAGSISLALPGCRPDRAVLRLLADASALRSWARVCSCR